MNKLKLNFLMLLLSSLLIFPSVARAELSPKSKAFLVMAGYGTVGGALLGFATMAYGSNSRAIAQGASLGLYAGIIFGSYIILSHKKPAPGQEPPPADFQDPYAPPQGQGGMDGAAPMEGNPWNAPSQGQGQGADDGQGASGGFFGGGQRIQELNDRFTYKVKGLQNNVGAPIYFNFVNYKF